MQGLGDFLLGDFLFWGFFLLFPSIRLSPFVHSPLSPHRIIIRQIRLSAASLHDMPSLACGASLDMVPAPSLANTLAFTLPPTHIDGLPAPQAFNPNTLAFLSSAIILASNRISPLSALSSLLSSLSAVYIDFINVRFLLAV
jgi:hypothetical protein